MLGWAGKLLFLLEKSICKFPRIFLGLHSVFCLPHLFPFYTLCDPTRYFPFQSLHSPKYHCDSRQWPQEALLKVWSKGGVAPERDKDNYLKWNIRIPYLSMSVGHFQDWGHLITSTWLQPPAVIVGLLSSPLIPDFLLNSKLPRPQITAPSSETAVCLCLCPH